MIDLRTCKYGDKLLMKNGEFCWYVENTMETVDYPHLVMYDAGLLGTRTDSGGFYTHREDESDVIEIIPC